MSKTEDISEHEIADKNNKIINKFIAFTYRTSDLAELEIYFEPELTENSPNVKCNKNNKGEKNLNANNKFETFSLPRWFSKTSVFSSVEFASSYIFFINIKDVNMLDVRYHLVQKCDRKLKGGVGKYYSNLFELNNEIDPST
jgi:hypothetical protein